MRKVLLITVCWLMVLGMVVTMPPVAGAGKYNIRAATVLVDDSPTAKCLFMFKDIVESQTWGDITVEVFTNGKLGSERENIEACQLNNLQLATPSVGVVANFSKPMRLLNIPFLLTDRKVAHKILVKDPIRQKLLSYLNEVGLVGLAFTDYGMRNLTSKKEVPNLAALKGLKVRTMKVPDHLALWEALGASPTPIAFTELYGALQQGVVDAQENPWETIYLSKFYEVQDNVTVTGHIYDVQPMIMSKKFYDRLPPEYQEIVQKAADIVTEYMWYLTAQQDDLFKAKCVEKGMKVNYFSQADLEKSQELTQPVVDEIRKVVGDALVDEYISAVKSAQ
ncbi:MAG: TRAP transporter substrate-binding protein [Desulfobacterales bacterium]|nr:MAG: TRAP transporter substrate-binding protein [Desulfobacterales bacterium]